LSRAIPVLLNGATSIHDILANMRTCRYHQNLILVVLFRLVRTRELVAGEIVTMDYSYARDMLGTEIAFSKHDKPRALSSSVFKI
jgi:hypothetical protein